MTETILENKITERNEFDLSLSQEKVKSICDFIRNHMGKVVILKLGKKQIKISAKLDPIHLHQTRIGWIVGVELKNKK